MVQKMMAAKIRENRRCTDITALLGSTDGRLPVLEAVVASNAVAEFSCWQKGAQCTCLVRSLIQLCLGAGTLQLLECCYFVWEGRG
ncbi:hypothetical protein D3C84_1045200 [compost metagenome]